MASKTVVYAAVAVVVIVVTCRWLLLLDGDSNEHSTTTGVNPRVNNRINNDCFDLHLRGRGLCVGLWIRSNSERSEVTGSDS